MGRGKQNIVSNADRVLITKTLEDETKKRKLHAKGLREGNPRSLEWAAKVGLKHWHAIGFGCGPDCLKDAGTQEDPDRINVIKASASIHCKTRYNPERMKKREKVRKAAAAKAARESRLRREGMIA